MVALPPIDPRREATDLCGKISVALLPVGPSDACDCTDYAKHFGDMMATAAVSLDVPAECIRGKPTIEAAQGAADQMREFLEVERRAVETLRKTFHPVFQAITKQVLAFVDSFTGVAVDEYQKHHGRLPGSDRTVRLRKKRRTRVLHWFFHERLPQQQDEALGFQGPLVPR